MMCSLWRGSLLTLTSSLNRRVFQCCRQLGRSYNIASCMPEAVAFQGVSDHSGLYKFSVNESDRFWGAVARQRLSWISPFHTVQNCDFSRGKIKWFEGGKLNVSVNCLDRHVHTYPERVALIWERDEPGTEVKITYRQLLELTCRLGNLLKRQGVRRGDCVTIYMPPCPLAVASMLACARIGAAHNVVFAGFSSEALADRIRDAQSSTVITVNQGVRGGKVVDLKRTVDQAVQNCPSVQQVLVAMRTENTVAMTDRDVPLEEYVFNYHDGDVFGCVADIGWITGHSYIVYGPLCNGGTTVLFESTPVYPNPGRYWEMVERLGINQFYGAPTAIRLLLKYGDEWVQNYNRSSLKTLGSVGEPINTEAWEWYHRVVGDGRCPVVDTWWQTETGGICIAPRPSDPEAEIVPGMAMRPFYGIKPALLDTEGEVLSSNDSTGALCISQAWPGMARTIHNHHQRFTETYFQPYPGFFFTGDGAHRSKEGHYQIVGRLDDVINVSGHRLGTAELEDVVNQCPGVAESAAIGYSHDIKGEGVYVFVVLKKAVMVQDDVLAQQIREMVSRSIAKYACPDFIQVVRCLPKTRSGKIMRRVLRKVVERNTDELGDLSTLDDPDSVHQVIRGHRRLRGDGKRQ
ncbi:acetyl-coenzyme A synthetase 2-like, mitochondrial isoform X2 [Oncorhynchus keta]|uniref:acetyl-coenzyme A synthetase 2-like, mitochondrial isoform X2 n=1 Tax=Oncorhynchus keta TaxID=8018 RepID=UPI00227BB746|nr:acetyl-coenzyme A synthetase 2-like, mitochondrial isoform X2 [Oncorhynchus keta]